MKVGIIGAGSIGGTLVRRLAKLGHQVSVANSRGPETLAALAAETGAKAVTVKEAARAGEAVIITIPQKAVPELPADLFEGVPESVAVVDTGNYYPSLRDGHIEAIDQGTLDSEWVAREVKRPVVKAFNNIYYKSLLEKGAPAGAPGRIALPIAGDDAAAKATVRRLIEDLGFDVVDAGSLADSWRQQPGTPVYCTDLDAAAVERGLTEPDKEHIEERRAEAEEAAKRMIAAQGQG